jgi:hypothetical protein
MKWVSIYLFGYVVFMVGVFLALWKLEVLEAIGPTWTMILVVLAAGIGVMVAVANSGRKENIQIDTK